MQTRKRSSPSTDGDFEPNQRTKTTKSARTTRGATRKAKTAEQLLSEPKNTIFDDSETDLFSLISTPEARKAIEELRPDLVEDHRKIINDPGRARRCIANFQRDGRSGFYDPEWQSQAREAVERYKNGDFDDYLKWKLYQDWPVLEELYKAREKAEEEAQAAKLAKDLESEQDQEQRRFQTPMEVQTEAQSTNMLGEQEQYWEPGRMDMQAETQADIQVEKVEEQAQDQNQHGFQTPMEVQAQFQAENTIEEQKQDQEQHELEMQTEKMVEKQEQSEFQTLQEVLENQPEDIEPTTTNGDLGDRETNEVSGLSTSATSDQAPSTAQPSSTTAPHSEQLPPTPPREHSPDVQCVTDLQDPHSPSPQSMLEDLPKPLSSDVQLNLPPENTHAFIS